MTLEEYLDHLLAGEDEACFAEARGRAVDLDGLHRLYVDVIQPSQYRVGELWEGGKISVATEHLATATNSYVASACYAPLARASTGGPRALIACTLPSASSTLQWLLTIAEYAMTESGVRLSSGNPAPR